MTEYACPCLICQGPVNGNDWNTRERQTAQQITDQGWSVVGVDGEGRTPDGVYSIGMWHTFRKYDIAVFGLKPLSMLQLVNALGELSRQDDHMNADEWRNHVFEQFNLAIQPVHPSWYERFFGAAVDIYQVQELPIVQMVWPDEDGSFPWHDDAGREYRESQPMLWLPKRDHPPGKWSGIPVSHRPRLATNPAKQMRAAVQTRTAAASSQRPAAVVSDSSPCLPSGRYPGQDAPSLGARTTSAARLRGPLAKIRRSASGTEHGGGSMDL